MLHVDVEAKAREYIVEVAWSEEYQRFIATMPGGAPSRTERPRKRP